MKPVLMFLTLVVAVVGAASASTVEGAPQPDGRTAYQSRLTIASRNLASSLDSLTTVETMGLGRHASLSASYKAAALLKTTQAKLREATKVLSAARPPKLVISTNDALIKGASLLVRELDPVIHTLNEGLLVIGAGMLQPQIYTSANGEPGLLPGAKKIVIGLLALQSKGYHVAHP